MKKLFAVILAIVVMLSAVPASALSAAEPETPLVILQGYSGPNLFYDLGGENEKMVWHFDMDKIKDIVIQKIPELALGIGGLTVGQYDLLVKTVGEVLADQFEMLRCNPDGSSSYDLNVYPEGAEATRVSTLIANGEEQYIPEGPLVEDFKTKVSPENIFAFTVDWRMSMVDNVKLLDDYIQQVKQLTGSKRVNIYALSYGGQLGAAYLYYYGQKGDVNRIILNVPAIGGTDLAYDLVNGTGHFDIARLIEFIEIGFRNEDEWEWLVEAFGFENLNEAINLILQTYLLDIVRYWGSIWDLIPADKYDELRDRLLDPEKSAELIKKEDEMHHEVMANMSEGLRRAQKAGTVIAIMSNTGHEIGTCSGANADYIIDVHSSSGANCAKFGERFDKDYKPKNTVCSDPTHYHLSPAKDIDATCAYLPENTWFINGQFHGQSNWDRYSRNFYMDFLFDDKITDIYSDGRYPQFELAQNAADGLYVKFNNTPSGYHTSKDTEIVIESLSEQYETDIIDIKVEGAELPLGNVSGTIPAGHIMRIGIGDFELPDSSEPFTLTVIYSLKNGKAPFIKEKVFSFTALSDEQAASFKFLGSEPTATAPAKPDAQKPSEGSGGAGAQGTTGTNSTQQNTENEPGGKDSAGEGSPLSPNTGAAMSVTAAAALVMGAIAAAAAKRKKKS